MQEEAQVENLADEPKNDTARLAQERGSREAIFTDLLG